MLCAKSKCTAANMLDTSINFYDFGYRNIRQRDARKKPQHGKPFKWHPEDLLLIACGTPVHETHWI